MIRDIETLLNGAGHLVAVNVNTRFGPTWQPVCLEDGCGYVGPFVTEPKAHEIAEEHRLKSLGQWRAAK